MNVNGHTECMGRLRKLSCYIMQEDLMQPRLTVFEAMQFSMDLKLGSVPRETKLAAVRTTLFFPLAYKMGSYRTRTFEK